jgi:hypothetical protein
MKIRMFFVNVVMEARIGWTLREMRARWPTELRRLGDSGQRPAGVSTWVVATLFIESIARRVMPRGPILPSTAIS